MSENGQIRFIAPVGSVGGGISATALDEALMQPTDFIACDAGTTDAGPFSLGMGIPVFPREAVKRDLSLMLRAARKANIPVIVGSAGTAGADVHVDWVLDIVGEGADELGRSLRGRSLPAEQALPTLEVDRREGRIRPLGETAPLDAGRLARCERVVAMMGV